MPEQKQEKMTHDEIRKMLEAITPGDWKPANMVDIETGKPFTPERFANLAKKTIEEGKVPEFSFIEAEKEDGPADICWTGNGPTSKRNAAFIAAAPDIVRQLLEEVERSCLQYHELLFQVEEKHPNESRHETAIRLIKTGQRGNGESARKQSNA